MLIGYSIHSMYNHRAHTTNVISKLDSFSRISELFFFSRFIFSQWIERKCLKTKGKGNVLERGSGVDRVGGAFMCVCWCVSARIMAIITAVVLSIRKFITENWNVQITRVLLKHFSETDQVNTSKRSNGAPNTSTGWWYTNRILEPSLLLLAPVPNRKFDWRTTMTMAKHRTKTP